MCLEIRDIERKQIADEDVVGRTGIDKSGVIGIVAI